MKVFNLNNSLKGLLVLAISFLWAPSFFAQGGYEHGFHRGHSDHNSSFHNHFDRSNKKHKGSHLSHDRRSPESERSKHQSKKHDQGHHRSFQQMSAKEKAKWVDSKGGPFAAPMQLHFFSKRAVREFNSIKKWRASMHQALNQASRHLCLAKFIDIKEGPQVAINKKLIQRNTLSTKLYVCRMKLLNIFYNSDFIKKNLR